MRHRSKQPKEPDASVDRRAEATTDRHAGGERIDDDVGPVWEPMQPAELGLEADDVASGACTKHPGRPAESTCDRCHAGCCRSCGVKAGSRSLCLPCALKVAGVASHRR
jgi:hypothetical protein